VREANIRMWKKTVKSGNSDGKGRGGEWDEAKLG
jgi:predicted lipoprotein with Yx(FWY)xxD motif